MQQHMLNSTLRQSQDAAASYKTRVTIRPGFPGFVPVLYGVSQCPGDLCKQAKESRFFTCKEGKETVAGLQHKLGQL